MGDPVFKEALIHIKEKRVGCYNNGPDYHGLKSFIKTLYKLGAENVEVSIHENEEDMYGIHELYVSFCRPMIHLDMMMCIWQHHPDELDEVAPGVIRIWWN